MAYIVTSISPTKTLAIDEVDATLTYLGVAKVGTLTSAARWQIKKIAKTGNVSLFQFADGDERYDNVWDNRASLTYS